MCEELDSACGVGANDVVISIMTKLDEDWSFGFARAQFVTGEP
jgi:hypothetical protein